MIANPVAMPRRSGNHLINVDTGEMYPRPSPPPPRTPDPSHSTHSWCVRMPTAPATRPPHQHSAATTPALRGPARSSQPPQSAADPPSTTKNSVYIQPSSLIFQSQLVVTSAAKIDWSGQASDLVMPMARDSGSQNTLKP